LIEPAPILKTDPTSIAATLVRQLQAQATGQFRHE
jgi:hypothetical protein